MDSRQQGPWAREGGSGGMERLSLCLDHEKSVGKMGADQQGPGLLGLPGKVETFTKG